MPFKQTWTRTNRPAKSEWHYSDLRTRTLGHSRAHWSVTRGTIRLDGGRAIVTVYASQFIAHSGEPVGDACGHFSVVRNGLQYSAGFDMGRPTASALGYRARQWYKALKASHKWR